MIHLKEKFCWTIHVVWWHLANFQKLIVVLIAKNTIYWLKFNFSFSQLYWRTNSLFLFSWGPAITFILYINRDSAGAFWWTFPSRKCCVKVYLQDSKIIFRGQKSIWYIKIGKITFLNKSKQQNKIFGTLYILHRFEHSSTLWC